MCWVLLLYEHKHTAKFQICITVSLRTLTLEKSLRAAVPAHAIAKPGSKSGVNQERYVNVSGKTQK